MAVSGSPSLEGKKPQNLLMSRLQSYVAHPGNLTSKLNFYLIRLAEDFWRKGKHMYGLRCLALFFLFTNVFIN